MNRFIEDVVELIWLEGLAPSHAGSVPEVLKKYLFEGPRRTYAIFDTASVNEGLALVETEPGFCGSLLEGNEEQNLADVMPCLLEISPDAKLTRRLFREVPGSPVAFGSLHLWPANPALFIRCNSGPK